MIDILEGSSRKVYLGCPYSGNTEAIMSVRAKQVSRAAGVLMQMGFLVMSPISQGHMIAQQSSVPNDWGYWSDTCQWLMDACDSFIILQLDGWEDSVGVKSERKIAQQNGMKISEVTPDQLEELLAWFKEHKQ